MYWICASPTHSYALTISITCICKGEREKKRDGASKIHIETDYDAGDGKYSREEGGFTQPSVIHRERFTSETHIRVQIQRDR